MSASGQRSDPAAYRSMSRKRVLAVFAVLTLVPVVMAIVPGRGQVIGYIGVPIMLLLAWRGWIMGAYVEPDGVRVVGIVDTKRVSWRDIDHFEVKSFAQYPYAGYIIRRDGRTPQLILAITAPRPRSERHRLQVQEPIDQLNQALADWRKVTQRRPDLNPE